MGLSENGCLLNKLFDLHDLKKRQKEMD